MGSGFGRVDWVWRSAQCLDYLRRWRLAIFEAGEFLSFLAVMMGIGGDLRFCTLKTQYSKGFSPPQLFRSSNLRLH
jgi:hypothetical protein